MVTFLIRMLMRSSQNIFFKKDEDEELDSATGLDQTEQVEMRQCLLGLQGCCCTEKKGITETVF